MLCRVCYVDPSCSHLDTHHVEFEPIKAAKLGVCTYPAHKRAERHLQTIAVAMSMHTLVYTLWQRCSASSLPTLAHRCIVPCYQHLLNLRTYSSSSSPITWLTHTNCNAAITSPASPPQGASLNPTEVNKFGSLADEWWDPTGPFSGLQRMNPARCRFIKDALCRNFGCAKIPCSSWQQHAHKQLGSIVWRLSHSRGCACWTLAAGGGSCQRYAVRGPQFWHTAVRGAHVWSTSA